MLAPQYARQGKDYDMMGLLSDAAEFGIKFVLANGTVHFASTALDIPPGREAIARLAAITLTVAGTQAVHDLRNKSK